MRSIFRTPNVDDLNGFNLKYHSDRLLADSQLLAEIYLPGQITERRVPMEGPPSLATTTASRCNACGCLTTASHVLHYGMQNCELECDHESSIWYTEHSSDDEDDDQCAPSESQDVSDSEGVAI